MKTNLKHLFNKEINEGVEILSIGTELLLGNIVNTNARWIAEQLSILGLNHFRQTTIGDNSERLSNLIKEISERSNLLITTGGLGPTPDDLTNESIAKAFDKPLVARENIWEEIKNKLRNKRSYLENLNLKKQCRFPEDALIIKASLGKQDCFFKLKFSVYDFLLMSFFFLSSQMFSLARRGLSKAFAIDSVVKSSGVGPRPPVVISKLLLSDISFIKLESLSELSPMVVCLK